MNNANDVTRAKPACSPARSPDLENLVRQLQSLETTNPCVQSSIGALAALVDPKKFEDLVADAREASATRGDASVEALFRDVLEFAEQQ
jgi:hypothetical protein